MNREEYLKFHREMCEEMVRITAMKNHDYSSADDPFANFKVVGALGLSAEHGFITRMTDKLSRLSNFVIQSEMKVKDETFQDTCLDLANYALLFAGFMRAKSREKTKEEFAFLNPFAEASALGLEKQK